MKIIKKILLALFSRKLVAKIIVRKALQCHTLAYKYAGRFSCFLEPGGLHPKHRLMNYHQWFIDHMNKDWTVLDVGCGNGALSYDLACSCRQVIAIDKNPLNIEKARRNFALGNIEYILGEVPACFDDRVFDAVVLSNVLEHIADRKVFLTEIMKKTKRILIRVPMIDRDWITLYKKEWGLEWRLDPTHEIEYTSDLLVAELRAAGLDVQTCDRRFGELYCLAVPLSESRKDPSDERLPIAAGCGDYSLF